MLIAVVRIRGIRNVKPKIRKTLELLRLDKPNRCVLLRDTPQIRGMLNVCKDYIAYGPIEEKTVQRLLKERGEKGRKKLKDLLKDDEIASVAKKIMHGEKIDGFSKPFFRLHPPRKGYKNIKKPYPNGDLGLREDMDQLLNSMI